MKFQKIKKNWDVEIIGNRREKSLIPTKKVTKYQNMLKLNGKSQCTVKNSVHQLDDNVFPDLTNKKRQKNLIR